MNHSGTWLTSSPTGLPSMRPPAWAILVLALAAAGCPKHTAPPEAALPGQYNNRGRIEAMLSIHAHYFWPDGRFPPDVRPMPLDDAARYLMDDPGRLAPSRQRRAIARLAAVGLDRREFRQALRILGADPEFIEAAIERHELDRRGPSGPERADTEPGVCQDGGDESPGAGGGLSVTELETFVCELFRDRTRDVCDYECQHQDVSPPGAPTASYVVKIRLPRSYKEVAKSIDPQTWDHCSKFYCPPERTYLAHKSSTGAIVRDPSLPPGSAYSIRTLYEHFVCPLQDCKNATFELLLDVATSYNTSSNSYQVLYGRNAFLKGSMTGIDPSAVGVVVDHGQLSATDDPGTGGAVGTVVYADKTLALTSSLLTGIYHGALDLIEAELGGELAEMACCAITEDVPTKCPD